MRCLIHRLRPSSQPSPTIPFYVLCLLLSLGCHCSTWNLGVMQQQETLVTQQWQGKIFALRTSCYVGALYDENEYDLLHPSPFSTLMLLEDMDHQPILPKAYPHVIVPAGTLFQVLSIEFPTPWRLTQRLLRTPRHYPWMHVKRLTPPPRVGQQHPRGNDSPNRYVWIIPLEPPHSAQDALSHLATYWGDPDGFQSWLAHRKPTVQAAIRSKQVLMGMSEEERFASQGPAIHWLTDTMGDHPVQVAWFPQEEIWLESGTVVRIQESRPMPQGPGPLPGPSDNLEHKALSNHPTSPPEQATP